MVEPSRNAPCPCGSGRKYKNCCAEAPKAQAVAETLDEDVEESDDAEGEESEFDKQDEVLASLGQALAERAASEGKLFYELDLWHPAVTAALDVGTEQGMDEIEDLAALTLGLDDLSEGSLRLAHAAKGVIGDIREEAKLDAQMVEVLVHSLMLPDESPFSNGARLAALAIDLDRLAEKRTSFEEDERDDPSDDASIEAATDEAAAEIMIAEIDRFGDKALMVLENLCYESGFDRASKAMVAALAQRPGFRSSNLLAQIIVGTSETDVRKAATEALRGRPEARSVLVFALHQTHIPPTERIALLEAMVDLGTYDASLFVQGFMLEELEPLEAEDVRSLGALMARSGDPSCEGWLVDKFSHGVFGQDVAEALAPALSAAPWWKAVAKTLQHMGCDHDHDHAHGHQHGHDHTPHPWHGSSPIAAAMGLFAASAEDCALGAALLQKQDPQDMATYHEGLQWLKPMDLPLSGTDFPWKSLVSAVKSIDKEADEIDVHSALIRWWMTPHPSLQGRLPVDVISGLLDAKPNPFTREYREKLSNALLDVALQDPDLAPEEARRYCKQAEKLNPERPWAKHVRKLVESRR